MGVNENILDNISEIPKGVTMYNQLTSPQSIRAVIAVMLTMLLVYQVIAVGDLSEPLLVVFGTVLGSYFEVPATRTRT